MNLRIALICFLFQHAIFSILQATDQTTIKYEFHGDCFYLFLNFGFSTLDVLVNMFTGSTSNYPRHKISFARQHPPSESRSGVKFKAKWNLAARRHYVDATLTPNSLKLPSRHSLRFRSPEKARPPCCLRFQSSQNCVDLLDRLPAITTGVASRLTSFPSAVRSPSSVKFASMNLWLLTRASTLRASRMEPLGFVDRANKNTLFRSQYLYSLFFSFLFRPPLLLFSLQISILLSA